MKKTKQSKMEKIHDLEARIFNLEYLLSKSSTYVNSVFQDDEHILSADAYLLLKEIDKALKEAKP